MLKKTEPSLKTNEGSCGSLLAEFLHSGGESGETVLSMVRHFFPLLVFLGGGGRGFFGVRISRGEMWL